VATRRVDQADHLTTVTPSGTSAPVTYEYDAFGLRTSRTRSGTTVHYSWDRLAGNRQLLDDGDHAYIYGPDGTALEQIADDDTSQLLHTDGLGSIRALSDTSGTLIGSIAYTPYGTPEHQTGQSSDLGYTGELTDPTTGLVYLRARDYDPASAAFLTRDPIETTTRDPYGYTAGDPLNHTDPSGLIGLDDLRAAGSWLSNASAGLLDGVTAGLSTQLAGSIFGFDADCADFGAGFALGRGTGIALGMVVPGGGEIEALGAAGRAAKGETTLYRAVSDAELDDIAKNGLRVDPSGRGYQTEKLFTGSARDAARQAQIAHRLSGQVSTIVEARFPSSVDVLPGHADSMDIFSVAARDLSRGRVTGVPNSSPIP
jgi:RHS repeat-associated protein